MMRILLCVYPNYADFQIGHLLFFLKKIGKAKIETTSIDGEIIKSLGGLRVRPDISMNQVQVKTYDLILCPGGDLLHEVADDPQIHYLLQTATVNNVPIASLCGSTLFLAKAGLLNDKKFTCNTGTYEQFKNDYSHATYTGNNVEVEASMITAKGTAFIDFTVAVGHLLKLWKSEEQVDHVLAFCRGEL